MEETSVKFGIISGCLISSRPQQRAAGARLYVVCTLMSITFRGERSALLSRNPQHMIFISGSYKMSPRTTKSSLAKNKKECIFFPSRCPKTNANTSEQVEGCLQNLIQLMLSQPINIQACEVGADRGLYAPAARIKQCDAAPGHPGQLDRKLLKHPIK